MKKYVIGLRKQILVFTLIYLINTLSFAMIPLVNKALFDSIEGSADYSLLQLVFFYVICVLVHLITAYGSNIWSWKIGIKYECDIKRDFFSTISRMPYVKFKEKNLGDYISIQGNDITTIETDYLTPLISLFNQILMFAVYGVILFAYVDWRVALALLITTLLILPFSNFTSKKLSKRRKNYSDKQGNYTSRITDFISGKHLISRITMTAFEREHEQIRDETAKARYAFGKSKSFVLPFNASFSFILTIVAFAVTGYLLFNGQITIGIAIAALGYIEAFLSPLQEIVYDVTTIASTKEVRDKVLNFLNVSQEELDIKETFRKSLTLDHVTVKIDQFQIRNFTFTFDKNKKYAIIGRNGCGKSTIMRAIAKHLVPDSGSILFDGINSSTIDVSGIICYVSQHEHLFKDSFHNNVTLFSSYQFHPKDIIESVGSDIYNRLYKQENCQALSGGEKQIIKFVRMLAEDKPICILDEPFSDLDYKREQRLMEKILSMRDKTFLVVTHNLSDALMNFDEVLLIDNGEILLHGSYTEISNTEAFKALKSEEAINHV